MKASRVKDNGILLEKETYYTVTINQLQLDILSDLTGRVSGENEIRKECDKIYDTLFKYSSQNLSMTADPLSSMFRGVITVNQEYL